MKSYLVYGVVQGVMFRQTFIRGLIKRGLKGGATNNNDNEKTVTITILGGENEVKSAVDELISFETINSWGAKVQDVKPLDELKPISSHQVTTDNVDDIKWSSGVEFYF